MPIRLIQTPAEAADLIAFFLAPGMFPTPLTPGEQQVIRTDPYDSLAGLPSAYWIERGEDGRIAAGLGMREHPNRTGIFELTCIAVAPGHRRQGVGKTLMGLALERIARSGGRGMLVDTSDHPAYQPMRALLERCGFRPVGHLPDFYFQGEGTLLYYRLFTSPGVP